MHRVATLSCSLLMAMSMGCSTLGLSTSPVAHTLTEQTKQVLNSTPRNQLGVPRELAKQVLPTHYLEPGDELLIESNDIESEIRLPADQQVAADGSVDLAQFGRVKVASLTLEQAEELIQSTIGAADQGSESINVRLIQPVQRYYVIGEVNSPGAYPLTGHETVLDGIMAAGGLTTRASACDLLVARPTDPCSCRVTLPVCYRAITQLGDSTTNYQIKPGDRIFVGRQTIWEEVTQFCSSEQGCERCCKSHVACRDAIFTGEAKPCFITPEVQNIPAPATTGTRKPTGLGDGLGDWDEIHIKPTVESKDDEPDVDTNQSTSEPQQALDGELDFGDLLNQPLSNE